MVIEIAGADIHFIGNVYSRSVGLALLIKQREASVENTVPCFHAR